MDFFKELQSLREKQPVPCILTVRSENADYCPYHASGKNCYLLIGHNSSEDCMYGFWVGNCLTCVDNGFIEKCELCYECIDCGECYNCNACQDCTTCTDCWHCYDCKGCKNCFGCVNLRTKQFYIFNQPYSQEEYIEKIEDLKKQSCPLPFIQLKEQLPRNAMQGVNNEHVVGNHISNSKNVFYSFDASEQEDTMYMFNASDNKDCMDLCYTGQGSELSYMCQSAVRIFNCNFCNVCWFSQNLEYCEYVFNSRDCFGCVSRNHAEYEILNQKYPKEEYLKKVSEIKTKLKKEGSYGRWWWPSPYQDIPDHLYML